MRKSLPVSLVLAAIACQSQSQSITLPPKAAKQLAYDIITQTPENVLKNDVYQLLIAEGLVGALGHFTPWGYVAGCLTSIWRWGFTSEWYTIYQRSSNPNLEAVRIHMGLIPNAEYVYYPEFTLLRELHSPDVYVMIGKAPLYVRSGAYFNWNSSLVRVVLDGEIKDMSKIPANGTMFKEENKPEVWYMYSGWKCHLMSNDAVNRYGGWWFVEKVPDGSIGHIPTGFNIY